MHSNRRRDNTGVLLLLHFILSQAGLENVPPVTLVIVILQACVYMRLVDLPWKSASGACISFDKVWVRQEWWRIFYGALEHGDSMHLYYNMVSFVWKGMLLEPELGSAAFLYLLALFTTFTGITLVGLCYICGTLLDEGFYYQCAVGFSGVVFALKVVNNHYLRGRNPRIMGITLDIPSGYIVWLELILIQLITPNASFVGHLAGILVGLAYVHNVFRPFVSHMWQISGRGRTYIRGGYLNSHQGGLSRFDMSAVVRFPIVIALSGLLVTLYMGFLPLAWAEKLHTPCVNAYTVLQLKKWDSLLLSSLHCYSIAHLVYTIVSLLGVGYYLEQRLGSPRFLVVLGLVTVMTNLTYCFATNTILPGLKEVAGVHAFEMPHKCFLGLTGALIALKVIYSYYYRYGDFIFLCFLLPVPKVIGAALEIVLMHFFLPHAWVIGNVCGFLVGTVYVLLMLLH